MDYTVSQKTSTSVISCSLGNIIRF